MSLLILCSGPAVFTAIDKLPAETVPSPLRNWIGSSIFVREDIGWIRRERKSYRPPRIFSTSSSNIPSIQGFLGFQIEQNKYPVRNLLLIHPLLILFKFQVLIHFYFPRLRAMWGKNSRTLFRLQKHSQAFHPMENSMLLKHSKYSDVKELSPNQVTVLLLAAASSFRRYEVRHPVRFNLIFRASRTV